MMKYIKISLVYIVLSLVLFTFLEGAASLLAVGRQIFKPLPQATVEFDKEIGWVGKPNLFFKNYYGPDTFLKTNSLGFIADHEFTSEPPPNKQRIICSGNSFPAGDGVGNKKNWCDQLERHAPVEALNLAQSGYSVDQTYLTFKRHAGKFKHHAHIVSFTGQDFEYLPQDNYSGRQKPLFAMVEGKAKQVNYPLGQNSASSRKMNYFITAGTFSSLHISQLLSKISERLSQPRHEAVNDSTSAPDDLAGIPVAISLFKELHRNALDTKNQFLLVYQPTYFDIYLGRHRSLRKELANRCKAENLPFYDLTTDLSDFSVREMIEGGNGHYMPQVHDRIAELLVQKLRFN